MTVLFVVDVAVVAVASAVGAAADTGSAHRQWVDSGTVSSVWY